MSKKRFFKNLIFIISLSIGLSFIWPTYVYATISSFPYVEDFETAVDATNAPPPTGWVGTYNFKGYTGANYTSGGGMGETVKAGTDGTVMNTLTSDTVNYTGQTSAGLNFWIKGTSTAAGWMKVYYSTNGGTDWTLFAAQTGMNPFPIDATWHKCGSTGHAGYTFTMPNLDGQSNVKFKWEVSRTAGNFYLDDIAFTVSLSDTGFVSPSSHSDGAGSWNAGTVAPTTDATDRWTLETNAYLENNNETACTDVGSALGTDPQYKADHLWGGFNFSTTLGSNDTVVGIEVTIVDGRVSDAAGTDGFNVTLYTKNNSGAHDTWGYWGDTKFLAVETTTAGTSYTFGSEVDKWGLTNPKGVDFGPNTTFKVKVAVETGAKTDDFWFDHIKVKIYYIPFTNSAPTNDSVSVTLDTGYKMVANKQYTFTTTHSDANGYTDINICYFIINTLATHASGDAWFYGRYQRSDNTFAIRTSDDASWIDCGTGPTSTDQSNDYVYLDSSTSASGSGNTVTITWKIRTKWDWNDESCQPWIQTYDVTGDSPASYEDKGDDINIENDLIVYAPVYTADSANKVSSGSATIVDNDWIRGGTAVTATGKIVYEGTTSTYPPSSSTIYAQLWADGADLGDIYQNEITYANGTFSVAAYAVPNTTDIDYDFKIEVEDIPTGGSDVTPAATAVDSRIDADVPTGVGCSTPVHNATNVSVTPTLVATTASDTNAGLHSTPYYFELDTSTTFNSQSGNPLQNSGWQTATSWGPTALSNGTEYYWRVKAKDGVGNESSWYGHTTGTPYYGKFTTTETISAGNILINEVAFDETASDWIEFYVKATRNYNGLRIFEDTTVVKTFSDLTLTTGDYVVLHFNDSTSDDASKGSNGYWDFYTTDAGLDATDRILSIKRPTGDNTLIDVVIYSNNDTNFVGDQTEATAAVTASHWDSGAIFSGTSDNGAWTDSDYISANKSIGRNESSTDSNGKSDWHLYTTTHTKGAQNGSLVINEVLYDPSGTDTGNEWIELFNDSTSSINLNGYELGIYASGTDASKYKVMPNFTMGAGKYAVVYWNKDGTDETDLTGDTNGNGYWDLYKAYVNLEDIRNTQGFVGLWNCGTQSATYIIDYVEYGAGGQYHESDASTTVVGGAGIWDTGDYIAIVSESSSMARIPNGTGSYNGYDNNQPADWTGATSTTPGSANTSTTETKITITKWRECY